MERFSTKRRKETEATIDRWKGRNAFRPNDREKYEKNYDNIFNQGEKK